MWISFISGLFFGLGLAISNMLNPQRVLAFLDIFGVWDPTLALVMGGALIVTIPGFFFVQRFNKPLFAKHFSQSTQKGVDQQLLIGAILFGLGWGGAGLCPGPAIAALVSLDMNIALFCIVMIFSWWITDTLIAKKGAN